MIVTQVPFKEGKKVDSDELFVKILAQNESETQRLKLSSTFDRLGVLLFVDIFFAVCWTCGV